MSRVLVTGPESSGTRLVTRIVATGQDIEAVHRSLPHWNSWELFPEELGKINAAVFVCRNWRATSMSQQARGLVGNDIWAIRHIRRAYKVFNESIGDIPWWMVIYQNLIHRPYDVCADLSVFLGAEVRIPDGEELYDANLRWLGPKRTGE